MFERNPEKQPFSGQRYPVKQPCPNMDMFDLPPGDPFAEPIVQIETAPMIPLKTAVDVPATIVKREPTKIKNCFGVEMELETLNTYEQSMLVAGLSFDGALREPLVQQQTVATSPAPRPNLHEEDTQQMEELGEADKRLEADRDRIERKLDAPVWQGIPRTGPMLWWQKDKHYLSPETLWHRAHPLAPYFGEPDIDNKRKKDEPKKPSHGQSAPWYVEGD